MSDIVPASPLADVLSKDRGSPPGDPGITMIEQPFLGYVNLRGDVRASVFTATVNGVLGVAIPPLRRSIALSAGWDPTSGW